MFFFFIVAGRQAILKITLTLNEPLQKKLLCNRSKNFSFCNDLSKVTARTISKKIRSVHESRTP